MAIVATVHAVVKPVTAEVPSTVEAVVVKTPATPDAKPAVPATPAVPKV